MLTEIHRSGKGKQGGFFIVAALIVSVLFLLPILGCLGGAWYGTAWHSGTTVSWKPLPPLPGEAAEILGAGTGFSKDGWVVYVKTTDQKIYSCSVDSCWLEKTVVPEYLQANEPCDPPVYFKVPLPPGKVVDSLEAQDCYPEIGYQVDFALLEDGSVWRWQHWTAALSLFERLFVSIVCGTMLGMLGSTVIAGFIVWRFRRKKATTKFTLPG